MLTPIYDAFARGAGKVYNIGGSRHSNCSILEAINYAAELSGCQLKCALSEQARAGDHIWWISDVRRFQCDYPDWSYRCDQRAILREIVAAVQERAEAV